MLESAIAPVPPPPPLTFAKRVARPLFALLAPATVAACASAVYPLCDAAGAPACGNIGQAGRQGAPCGVLRAPMFTVASRATVVPAVPELDAGARLRPLVLVAAVLATQPAFEHQADACKLDQLARPIVDDDFRPACGNVMTKGGRERGRR